MLMQIEIRNIAIIDYALIDFNEGFHVMTGETGAGKSIILDSISLLAGERAQKELIRMGEEMASVKGVFSVNETNRGQIKKLIGSVEDDYLTVERILYKDGKSIAKINGKIEPLKTIKELVLFSLEICGQKSHIDLMKEAYYRELIDSIAPSSFQEQLEAYRKNYRLWKEKKKELENWRKNDREQEQMLDLYKYQLNEIEQAELTIGEDEALEVERKKLTSFEKLNASCQKALQVFEQLQDLYVVEEAVGMIATLETEFESLKERVQTVSTEIEDIHYEVRKYSDNLEYDEERLNHIIYRDEDIKKIKRKYGNTIEEVLHTYEEIKEKIEKYDRKEEVIVELTKEIQQLEKTLGEQSLVLHAERKVLAEETSKEIEKELHDLAMPHAEFSIRVAYQDEWNEYGKDEVLAYFNANKGEELRLLNKIASGGEMARVLLAIKVVVNEKSPGKTLIFDEVDEGIGGGVGLIIGDKMSKLGKQTQVIVISHLPQVAAKAISHYKIIKNVVDNRTFSTIEKMTEAERVEEISRMLYGSEADETTRIQATKMLKK